MAWEEDEHGPAMTLLEESLGLFREMGDRHNIAIALSGRSHPHVGVVARREAPAIVADLQAGVLPQIQ